MSYHDLTKQIGKATGTCLLEIEDSVVRQWLIDAAFKLQEAHNLGRDFEVMKHLGLSKATEPESASVNVYICERGHTHKAPGCPEPKEPSERERLAEKLYNSDTYCKWLNKDKILEIADIALAHFKEKGDGNEQ